MTYLPEARERVIAEALSFERTQFHHMGRLKIKYNPDGSILDVGGVDCAQFPYLVYHTCGLIPFMPVEYYPPDWYLHRGEERYLNTVMTYAHETDDPLPGDFVVFQMVKNCPYAHGAIILGTGLPDIIHANSEAGCVLRDRADGGRHGDRPRKFFTLW